MVTNTVEPLEDTNFPSKCATELFNCPLSRSQGIKIPVYYFGTKCLMDNSVFGAPLHMVEEEQSLLDSLLLGQWEDRMLKGHFRYDVTASEIKVISGQKKFLAQLNIDRDINCLLGTKELGMSHQMGLFDYDWIKHHEKLLFCIKSSNEAYSELVPLAAVPEYSILTFINVNPIEYGHVLLVPHGFNSLYPVLDAGSLEMVARVAVEMNNGSFRLFYDCSGHITSPLYFEACYFPNLLPVELMPVETLFADEIGGINISAVADYPIKTLLFESNCNFKMTVEVISEICSYLLDKNIPHNMFITDCGKKIFLFLQLQTLATSHCLSAWECGGYFLFSSRQEFDQVTEAALLKRMSTVTLDDNDFAVVKQLCCSVVRKLVI